MALTTLIDKISEASDNGEIVGGVFLDFSKAFGIVDHEIALQKTVTMAFKMYNWNGLKVIYQKDTNMLIQ